MMPDRPLEGLLALVTGASGGIGRATCLVLADQGCNIAVHYFRNQNAARDIVSQCKDKGVKSECFGADLSNYDDVSELHSLNSSRLVRSIETEAIDD